MECVKIVAKGNKMKSKSCNRFIVYFYSMRFDTMNGVCMYFCFAMFTGVEIAIAIAAAASTASIYACNVLLPFFLSL